MKKIVGGVLALIFGLTGITYAAESYYPPERIRCGIHNAKLACNDFNRDYLTEDTYNADFNKGDINFHFGSAVAYFTQNQAEASVFFTYRNSENRMVKLRTINTAIKPDMKKGNWKKVTDDIYTCDTGYMSCPLTNLPSFS